jgi:Na+-transporting methylmalonyl-CoA/oxaloacetate decarboxylase beta subunit
LRDEGKLSSEHLSAMVISSVLLCAALFFYASLFCDVLPRILVPLTFGYVLQGVVDTALSKVGLSEHLLVVQLLQLANKREQSQGIDSKNRNYFVHFASRMCG